MKNQTYEALERYLHSKRQTVDEIDRQLNQELLRQRLLQEIPIGDSSLSASEVYSENESMQRSNVSGVSLESHFIEDQIAKVKAFMRNHSKPVPPIDLHQTTFRHRNRSKTSSNMDVTSKHHTVRQSLKEESEFELKTLPQDWKKSNCQEEEISQPERTVFIRPQPSQNIEKRVIAREAQRQKEMEIEREAIRQQLIKENDIKLANERERIFKQPHQQINFPPQSPISPDLCQTLKLQRTKQFSSILRQIKRSNIKADRLQGKLRQL